MIYEKLTECEQMVMKTVWNAGEEIGLIEIMRRANDQYQKEWKPQTVSTFLARLVRKGYLKHYRTGRVFLYQILVPFEEYRQQITNEFIDFWYHGSDTADMRVALAAYNTLISYCRNRQGCESCLLETEPNGELDGECLMKYQDCPYCWQQLDMD